MTDLSSEISEFLPCPTPNLWIEAAIKNQALLLIDHAHCEKKAASTAIRMMFRYPEYPALLKEMSQLAREELRHFDKVIKMMNKNQIVFKNLSPSRYARELLKTADSKEPNRLLDLLVVSAFIEARSCERFAVLIPQLSGELKRFYTGLLAAEARHFKIYLQLAQGIAQDAIKSHVNKIAEKEAELITSPDSCFRFHSGIPT